MFEAQNAIKAQAVTEKASSVESTPNGPSKATAKPMQPEYGFKPKGPEPTRFGDWQVKGKCVDF